MKKKIFLKRSVLERISMANRFIALLLIILPSFLFAQTAEEVKVYEQILEVRNEAQKMCAEIAQTVSANLGLYEAMMKKTGEKEAAKLLNDARSFVTETFKDSTESCKLFNSLDDNSVAEIVKNEFPMIKAQKLTPSTVSYKLNIWKLQIVELRQLILYWNRNMADIHTDNKKNDPAVAYAGVLNELKAELPVCTKKLEDIMKKYPKLPGQNLPGQESSKKTK